MKIPFLLLLLIGTTPSGFGQNLNMVIEVNDRLVTYEIAGAYLNFEELDGSKSRNLVGYHTGELVLQPKDWKKVYSDSTKTIALTFDFYALKGRYHNSVQFGIEMNKYHFNQSYLIVRVYDFRERKFRRRYSCLTDKKFIVDLNYPQGGVLVQCR